MSFLKKLTASAALLALAWFAWPKVEQAPGFLPAEANAQLTERCVHPDHGLTRETWVATNYEFPVATFYVVYEGKGKSIATIARKSEVAGSFIGSPKRMMVVETENFDVLWLQHLSKGFDKRWNPKTLGMPTPPECERNEV